MRIEEAITSILFNGVSLRKDQLLPLVDAKVGECKPEEFDEALAALHSDGRIIITTLSGKMNATFLQYVPPTPFNNKTIIVDVETTGLNVWRHQILEFAAVLEDWTTPIDMLPTFHAYVKHDEIIGDPFALRMNRTLIDYIYYDETCVSQRPEEVAGLFAEWLYNQGFRPQDKDHLIHINLGGKNVARFDLPFIENDLRGWSSLIKPAHRILDPGSLYFNPRTDAKLPDLKTCLEKAGMPKEVEHRAFADCYDTIRVARKFYAR